MSNLRYLSPEATTEKQWLEHKARVTGPDEERLCNEGE